MEGDSRNFFLCGQISSQWLSTVKHYFHRNDDYQVVAYAWHTTEGAHPHKHTHAHPNLLRFHGRTLPCSQHKHEDEALVIGTECIARTFGFSCGKRVSRKHFWILHRKELKPNVGVATEFQHVPLSLPWIKTLAL